MRREQPSVVLEELDGVASRTGAGMATMIYGVLDRVQRERATLDPGE